VLAHRAVTVIACVLVIAACGAQADEIAGSAATTTPA